MSLRWSLLQSLGRRQAGLSRANSTSAAPPAPTASSSAFFPVQSSPASYKALPKPASSLWYTSRPSLTHTLTSLSLSLSATRAHLFRSGLLSSIASPVSPTTEFATALPHPRSRRWKNAKDMATYLRNGTALRSSQYKKLTSLLGNLEALLPYASVADELPTRSVPTLAVDPVATSSSSSSSGPTTAEAGAEPDALRPQLEALLSQFQVAQTFSASGEAVDRISGRDRRLGQQDPQGRVMGVGRRKESGARVWIIQTASASSAASVEGVEASETIPGRVLVNTSPLPTYFPLPTHRTAAIRPLTLTATLGSFNVFVIAKGGGLAAQSEAVAMGLARALVEWEQCEIDEGRLGDEGLGWRDLLKRAKLLERDPRTVERKKTGQPKARKKYAWVKR